MERGPVMAAKPSAFDLKPLHRAFLPEVSWENIREPGAYVDLRTGDLYRIPQEALIRGASPLIHKQSLADARLRQETWYPFVTTLQARILCAEFHITPNYYDPRAVSSLHGR